MRRKKQRKRKWRETYTDNENMKRGCSEVERLKKEERG